MAKSRQAAAPETTDDLSTAVAALTDEVRVLRQAIDDLREEIQYATNNLLDRSAPPLPHRRIVSMPLDPTADDFAKRLNAVTPDDLPPEGDATQTPNADSDRPASSGRLF